MAYCCPLCDEPHPDAEHLANHLAFTALLGDDDHEEWLDEQTPGWEDEDESGLADRLRDIVEQVEHPIDDVETHDHSGHEGTGGAHGPREAGEAARSGVDRGALDAEAQKVVAEARELTREMQSEPGAERDEEREDSEDETE